MERLSAQADYYVAKSLSSGSQKTYLNGQQQYLMFCSQFKLTPYPPTELSLRYFVTFLAESLSFATIQTYLAAVRHKSIELGFAPCWTPMPLLSLVLKGIKRCKSDTARPARLPITIGILRALKTALSLSEFKNIDKLMLWAAFTTAFFGFLRSSEFCAASQKEFSPQHTLLQSDVKVQPDVICLNIKASKTDTFHKGVTIRLAKSGSSICPYNALTRFLHYSSGSDSPLFSFCDGSFLTRHTLTKVLNSLLRGTSYGTSHFSSHCFRIGAASTAAANGIPDWLVKVLGRWSSNCYQTYIRTPVATIDNVPSKLVLS